MPKKFTIVVEKDEDGYFVSEVLELPGCHSQAKTMDVLMRRTKEAIELYLDARPAPPTRFVVVKTLAV